MQALTSGLGGDSSAAIGPLIGSVVVGGLIGYYYLTVAKSFHKFVAE